MADLVSEVRGLTAAGDLDWPELAVAVTELLATEVPHVASCWHTVDPGTVLFTGSTNRGIGCSGSWLAEHEYVVEDVAKWAHLARTGRLAEATSAATHGHLSRSARHRSHATHGYGDELRVSFVADGSYWGAMALLRGASDRWFTEQDRQLLVSLSAVLGAGFRATALRARVAASAGADAVPGVLVLDTRGRVESSSPQAEMWLAELVEDPPAPSLVESRAVASVAARTRSLALGSDPLGASARVRVRTRSGTWLLLYGTPLSGGELGRVAIVLVPAPAGEIAPLVALAYALTPRETEVTQLCLQGLASKSIARQMELSIHTVQDHLKSVFAKTGVHSRGELLGQVFLEHQVPRWRRLDSLSDDWGGWSSDA